MRDFFEKNCEREWSGGSFCLVFLGKKEGICKRQAVTEIRKREKV